MTFARRQELDSRLRGNDDEVFLSLQRRPTVSPSSLPRRRESSDDEAFSSPQHSLTVSPSSLPRRREPSDDEMFSSLQHGPTVSPSSFPRRRESSVVGLVVAALLVCAIPAQAQEWVSLEKSAGAELFGEKCGMCHRATGMGTGILGRRLSPEQALLENRTDLQPALIETAVRAGFGVMFPISRAEVSDAQLQLLVEYLTTARARPTEDAQ
jgi:mono/diheme cytochrome c family protein